MTMLSKNARVKFTLDGNKIDSPRNWQDIEILATFDEESVQANISTDSFIFVDNEDYRTATDILDYISGPVGIFHGLKFEIEVFNEDNIRSGFNGFLDLTDGFEDRTFDVPEVSSKIIKRNGLNSFDKRLSALSYGYLEDLGIFTLSDYNDLDYVEVEKVNAFEELVAGVIFFMMAKEVQEAIKTTAFLIAEVVAIIGGSLQGAVLALVYATIKAALQIVYTAIITLAIIELGKNLINTLSPFIRTHQVLKFRTALEKVVNYLGYTFESNISDLDDSYYLPSNPQQPPEDFVQQLQNSLTVSAGTLKGIPNIIDYGYNCPDMFQLCLSMFNAKISIIGNVLHFRTVDDPFWVQNSTYIMPSARPLTKRFNTQDFKPNRYLVFEVDSNDTWTVDNYKGTAYQIIEDSIQTPDIEGKFIGGIDEVRFGVALGSSYDELNQLEKFLQKVAQKIDGTVNFLGGNSDLNSIFENKLNSLKQSDNWHSIPKVVKLNGRKLASNYRTSFSAKYLYDTYHNEKSFVSNNASSSTPNFYGQKLLFDSVEVPFSMEDFEALIDNSYFTDYLGRSAKAVKIGWKFARDRAVIDYWVREPYTKNLKETFIEPE